MAAVITAGTTGATGNAIAPSGGVTILCSGQFGNATVEIHVEADALRKAPIYTFMAAGGIKIEAASGSIVTATVVGGVPGSSIDVSII